jgi:hypothetical protein
MLRFAAVLGLCVCGIAWAVPALAQECVPRCRSAYVCIRGQCVSACNPPCEPGEKCTGEGACVPEGQVRPAQPAAPPPAPAPAPYQPPPPAGTAPQPHYPQQPPPPSEPQAPYHSPQPAAGTEPYPHQAPPPGDPAAQGAWGAPTSPQASEYDAPGFSFLARFGPTIGWFSGGHVELGLAFGLTDMLYLSPSVRVAGGMGWQGNPFVAVGGDFSLRIVKWGRIGGVGQVGVGVTYMHEFEGSREYTYVAPHARLSGGVLFGGGGGSAWGVEATTRLGHANNTYTGDGVDYSGFYGEFDVSFVLTL